MTWGYEKVTLGNDEADGGEAGKAAAFKPKVTFWSQLSSECILQRDKKKRERLFFSF